MKYIVLLIAIACIWGGGQGVYTAKENKYPTVYDINTLSGKNMPTKKWLQLENCDINLTEAIYFKSALLGSNLAKELYIPLNTQNDSITVFLAQKAKNVLEVFNLINTQTDSEKTKYFLNKYQHLIIKEKQTYTGVVRHGIDIDNKEWRQLASTSPKLVKNFIILDNNTTPNSGFSYTILVIGIVILLFFIRSLFNRKDIEETTSENN